MNRRYVLDSSAVLALLMNETGAPLVDAHYATSVISTVNLGEVATILFRRGYRSDEVKAALDALDLHTVPFDDVQAMRAASLITTTIHRGLSLGDRACLALGLLYDLPVMTADRAWEGVIDGLTVTIIR